MQKFSMPKDLWLKFGCFLSGHNYVLLSECSEASKREVKKITSALIIISLIWAIIGFVFSKRYLNFSDSGALFGSLFMVIIIVQVERQIILTSKLNGWAKTARMLLALIVAILGATIIDQYIFANDINIIAERKYDEQATQELESAKVNYDNSLSKIEQQINKNENLIKKFNVDLKSLPQTIPGGGGSIIRDAGTGRVIQTIGGTNIPNPQISKLQSTVDELIRSNQVLKSQELTQGDRYRDAIKKQTDVIRSRKKGFLVELNALIEYILTFNPYPTALILYLIWFFFFILIESLVLIIKSGNKVQTDYEKIIEHQQKIREERLKILEQKRSAALGENDRIGLSNDLISNLPR